MQQLENLPFALQVAIVARHLQVVSVEVLPDSMVRSRSFSTNDLISFCCSLLSEFINFS
jgi:hypothetical protein